MPFSYPKIEKLCSKILISKLFEKNQRITKYPLRLIWLEAALPAKVPVQSVVSVSKRRFKKAVTRNLLKRRMREAFRLNKNELYSSVITENKQLALMFIYQSNDILPFSTIEKVMVFLLNELRAKVSPTKASGSGLNIL
ncbi:MAG: ribonuclease P protein component [Bacteroidetes bacterium]|nr:MAG: ribonuclease P protein component [Bacteroidota bacterium]